MKGALVLAVLGLSIAFASWKKDNTTKDYHKSAEMQFVTADGNKIAYRVLGDKAGIPLVIVSPLGSAMDAWDPAVTNGLAQNTR
jgi:hypothetical protein